MNLLILGATGNMGQRLLAQGLARGHAVTAFVRNRAKLEQQLGHSLPQGLMVVEGNTDDGAALRAAMTGQDVVINCAGYVADGAAFIELVDRVVTQAEAVLGPGGRLWLFGGAGRAGHGPHGRGPARRAGAVPGAPDQRPARGGLAPRLVDDVPGAHGGVRER